MSVDVSAIFETVPSAYMLLDRELRFVWGNRKYWEVTGRQPDQVLGRVVTEAFPAEGEAARMLNASFERVFETGRADHLPLIPYPIAGPDGRIEQRYWSATHTPILDAEGRVEYVLQNTHDVTDLYMKAHRDDAADMPSGATGDGGDVLLRAETVAQQNLELGLATRFFETVFDQAPSIIAIHSGPDHVIRLANREYRRIAGTHRKLIGRPAAEALPELHEQGFVQLLDEVYDSGEAVTMHGVQAFVQTESGPASEIHVDFVYQPLAGPHGKTVGILVQGHDVTAQKRAEAELRAAEERFRTMAQTMPSHVWTARPDGGLDWVSDQVYDYTGTRGDEILGHNWGHAVHPEDIGRVAPIWAAAIERGSTYEAEFRLRDAAGGYRWFLVRAVPVRDAEGRVAQWIGTNADIEGRKATEAALAELNATLEERVESRNRALEEINATLRQSQKMEAIGNLAGGVAHDFNNLLQAITGSLQLAQRELPDGAPAAWRIEQAMGAVERGATLAAQLLAFGRRQPLEPRAVDLGRMIGDIDPILRSAMGEGVRIETRVARGLWNTLVDATNLENALLNLVVNARDAMEGQGRLVIDMVNTEIDARTARSMTDVVPGEYVRLSVVDEGSGMAPEVIEKIFEPFFTTKPEGRGTGLGMAMVYGFVKQSGGHVTIESAPGQGTAVRIYLPRSLRSEEPAAQRSAGPVVGGDETVLLVEDDDDVRLVAGEMLRHLGYAVIEAEDADAGLAVIEAGHDFDLLLTDVVMPGRLTSREMAERAQALRPGLPVLFASGYSRDAIVHDGRLDEGIQLLSKPYRRETLARRLRELLDGAERAEPQAAPRPAPGPPPPADAEADAAASGPGDLTGLRVLVCEDDTFIRLDLVEMLTAAGAEVREAATGAQALALLQEAPADRLLVDVGLPDCSGLDVAREAVARQPDLPVIFATGRDKVPGAEDLPQARVLTKPFGQAALLKAVTRGHPARATAE
ncbi:hybrid sensor histidine kinase/response regulator [Limimaricola hongkongensis]|uniref:histidine kinase n=1 Tax=Limimaricola hongkongensis DSM 17492 TaxID=1122180 RepID=A0A017HDV8_9RHOB|nr:PAS domain-containing protein [Limimaricola hongkongensis]EYD72692.1 PAS/PAC sensor hybrid histidine kinase [Limimaricola hongkongensis DSM 17492]